VVATALVVRAPGLRAGVVDPDEAALATQGMVVAAGGALYRDVIDRKPPLAPLVYAAAFAATGGRDLRPVRLLTTLLLAAAALALATDAARRGGRRAGWWAAGLFLTGVVALPPADAQAANYAHLALAPAAAALVCARRPGTGWALAGGVCLGAAVLTRQSWLVALAPALVSSALANRRGREPVLLVAGAAVPVAVAAAAVGPAELVYWSLTGYGTLLDPPADPGAAALRATAAAGLFLAGHAVLVALAVMARPRRDDVDLWCWAAAGLVAVAAGFRFFGHYWLQVLPPLCLLAGPAAARLTRRGRRLAGGAVAVTTVVFVALAWQPSIVHRRARLDPLARAVAARSAPGEAVAIWGSVPEVFWRTGRPPAGALVVTDFVVGRVAGQPDGPERRADAMPRARRLYVAALRDDPPRLLVDTSTGAGIRDYEHYPLRSVPRLAALVERCYRPVGRVGDATLYLRRDGAVCPRSPGAAR
jgi:4-amino-4-deoxy-L-arabinose transferase-like glycosyltransferase